MDFTNKNILVTGSSAGIGMASAELFLRSGATVIINGASLNDEKVVEDFNKKYGNRAVFIRADVSKVSECQKLYNESIKKLANIDVLVNCAGIVPVGTLLDFDEEDFDKAFDTNVRSTFFLSQLFVKDMVKRGSGIIVNVASIAGLKGPKNRALYSATKGAIISLTRAMASDFAYSGVRVNCVCPGMVYSPSLEKRINNTENPEKTRCDFVSNIPVGHIGTVEEVAESVCFAASFENSFMTGSIITVDGGASL